MALIFTFSFSFMVLGVVRRVAGAVARSGTFQTRNILPYFFRPVKGVGGRGGGAEYLTQRTRRTQRERGVGG